MAIGLQLRILKQYAGGYNSHCSLRHGPTHRASLQLAAAALLIMTNWTLPSSAAAEELEHSDHDPNTIALFVGAASEQRRQSGVAVGIEYERRLRPFFGLGALAEHTFGKIDTTVYAVPLAYHTGPWKAYVAPGLESGDAGNDKLLRIGIEYGFEHGDWEIAPQFDIDFVDGERVIVLGVTVGLGF